MAFTLHVGQRFSDLDSLEAAIKKYENESFTILTKSDSHRHEAPSIAKQYQDKPFKKELKYVDIKYSCHHGGKKFKTKGEGKRCGTTAKTGCKFNFCFKVTSDGQYLELVRHNPNHHETCYSQAEHTYHVKNRKLDNEVKAEIAEHLKLQCNRKLLKETYSDKTGKKIIMKDIHNIASRSRETLNKVSDESSSEAQDLAMWLKEKYPSIDSEFVVNTENVVSGIYIQDAEMKAVFNRFPEVILADTTYKTNNLSMPLFAMMAVDGHGDSHLVGAFILQNETADSLHQMLNCFKERNPRWVDISVVITDKDMNERAVFKSSFPDIQLQLCLYHTLRTFRREITMDKMLVKSNERDNCLSILSKLAYAESEVDYEEKYKDFLAIAPQKVIDYFNTNWHGIHGEWVEGIKSHHLNCNTTNRVESFFSKLKSVIKPRCSIKEMITHFMGCIATLRDERYFRQSRINRVPVSCAPLDAHETAFMHYLTPYAYSEVKEQLVKSCNITIISESCVQTQSATRQTTINECECSFFRGMTLPCRHILAQRKHSGYDIFCPDVVSQRWTRLYNGMCVPVEQKAQISVSSQSVTSIRPLSTNAKFRTASAKCQELASCLSEFGTAEFNSKLKVLDNILCLWKQNKNCKLVDVDDSSNVFNVEPSNIVDEEPSNVVDEEPSNVVDDEHNHNIENSAYDSVPTTVMSSGVKLNDDLLMGDQCDTSDIPVSDTVTVLSTLATVSMPHRTRKRGRPKGSVKTVIGLPKKRTRLIKSRTDRQMTGTFMSTQDLDVIQDPHGWLTDKHMTATNILLGSQFTFIDGLQDTLLQQRKDWVHPISNFVQFFHINNSHWICVTSDKDSTDKTVLIYDSMGQAPSGHVKNLIAQYVRTSQDSLTFNVMNVDRQTNGHDCGVYAIAFATSLVHGQDPSTVKYMDIRQHLHKCLSMGRFTMFPTVASRRTRHIRSSVSEVVYCLCKGIDDGNTMIQCDKCNGWYHEACVGKVQSEAWLCGNC